MRSPEIIPVVAAVIIREGRYLVAQRPPNKHLALKWEFPGGKVEKGESPDAALLREIREELGCPLLILKALPCYVHHYESVSIKLMPFIATLKEGVTRAASS